MMRRWRISAGVVLALLATSAFGSGPEAPGPVYVFADPQNPSELAAMANGRLGILKGATSDALLFLDWRRLNGLAVGQEAATALAAPCCGEPASQQKTWLAVRNAIPGVTPIAWLSTDRRGPNYTSIATCFDDAFATATATLADRVQRYGRTAPTVRAWVNAQDAVFRGCSEPVVSLPAPPPDAPLWLLEDRAYQEAALALYDGQADDAARRFASIARDPASPWRPLGQYLAARALWHLAIDAPSPSRYAAAHAALERLAAEPAGTYGQRELPRMRQALAFRQQPNQLLARLDRDLNAAQAMPDIAPAVRDYLTLADARPAKPEAADWIRTVQAKNPAAGLAHALARWHGGRKTVWLVAALSLVDPADPAAPTLAAAAGRLAQSDPAWLTACYHRLRLLLPSADAATVGREADAALAREDLSRTDRNVLLAMRAQTAATLADFAAHALRRPYCGGPHDGCDGFGPPAGDTLLGRLPNGERVGLGPDARAAIDRLPLRERMRLGEMTVFPPAVRLDLALTSYVRAVLLRDDAAVDHLATRLTVLLPQVAGDWHRIARTPPGPDKLFDEAFVMLKIPSLRADLADYARPVGTVRQFAGYWVNLTPAPPGRVLPAQPFAPAAAYTAAGWWGGMADPDRERVDLACLGKCGDGISPLHAAPFLQPLLPRALVERRSFQVGRTSYDDHGDPVTPTAIGRSLWGTGYAYAAAHPGDPRSPEALYRLIRVARWGANPDDLGRRAFLLLHRRYPRSTWTQRSPYYYR